MAEMEQLGRKLDERVLERAEADPEWKRQFVEDPATAVSDIPEARRLREMVARDRLPGQPPEATMVAPKEEERQLMRSLSEKVLERAANDPLWKQRLLNDAPAAMREAGFPEVERLDEIRQQEEEVRGHYGDLMTLDPGLGAAGRRGCPPGYTCGAYSRYYLA
jgi:hypothetical protein